MARGDRKTVRWANDRQKKKKEREKKKLAPFLAKITKAAKAKPAAKR